MSLFSLIQTGTAPSCYGTPAQLFEAIAQSFGINLNLTGVLRSVDEPDPDQRDLIWYRLNPDGSEDAEYNYWTTGPSGAGWYRKEPYFIGQVCIFESGPPSTRWKICDGSNGTLAYSGRLIGCSGQGVDLTNRPQGTSIGEETHTLTGQESGLLKFSSVINNALAGPFETVSQVYVNEQKVTPPTTDRYPMNQTPHNNMPPSLFVPYYKFVGPQYALPGT